MPDYIRVDCKILNERYKRFKDLPLNLEYIINKFLWNEAGPILEKEIYKNIPYKNIKKYSKKAPNTHAKTSKSLEIVRFNLGVKVKTITKPKLKDFGYLIFPNDGIGQKQMKKGKQEFFEKSLTNKTNYLREKLLKNIDDILKGE